MPDFRQTLLCAIGGGSTSGTRQEWESENSVLRKVADDPFTVESTTTSRAWNRKQPKTEVRRYLLHRDRPCDSLPAANP